MIRKHIPGRLLGACLLTLNAALNSGCAPAGADGGAGPDKLVFAYLPSEEDPELRTRSHEALGRYLEGELGMPVEVIKAVSYAPTIEAMRAGKIDVMRAGGSFTYLIAHDKAGAEAIVSVGTSAGRGLYRSIIVTSPATGIDTLEELIERAGELDFAFVDPASTSGHLIPRTLLESRGVDPDEAFARIIYTMDHTNSAMTIMSAKVHAGGMSRNTYERLVERGRMDPGDLVILWESDPIPTGPVMVRDGLPEAMKKTITEAYLKINDPRHPLHGEMAATYDTDDLRFHMADDAEWNGLRRVAWNLDTMTLLSRHEGGS